MADKVEIEAGGKERVAMDMAYTVIRHIEGKEFKQITREEYLKTVAQCVHALRGAGP